MRLRTGIAYVLFLALSGAALLVQAAGTKTQRYSAFREFDPDATRGVLISSLGELRAGYATRRVDIAVPFVRSSATAPDGTIYLGTGDKGEIYAYKAKGDKGELRKVAVVDTPVISAMAMGPDGKIYCGTVADGRVVAVDPKTGAWTQVVQLGPRGESHVWSLAWDGAHGRLWAGTGPKGELYAIENGQSRLVWSSTEKHLLALRVAADGSGAVYVGSGEKAILYRVEADGRARVLHAFAADEIQAIFEKSGTLLLTVNEFSSSGGGGTRISFSQGTPPTKSAAPLPRMGVRQGKGAVYRWDPDGRIEQIFAAADTWLSAVHGEANGDIMAAAGGLGRVYRITPERTSFVAYEFTERQVLTMELEGPVKIMGTGDRGGLYVLQPGPPKESVFVAPVFDATFPTRFGALRWRGTGRVVFEVRTGNTPKPDKTWSGWGPLGDVRFYGDEGSGRVRSEAVRYLQWRVKFLSENAVVREVVLHYLPQNQRPRITEVTMGDPQGAAQGGMSFGGGGATPPSTPPKNTVVKIRWKVENPDGDTLEYRVYVRAEKDAVWRPLTPKDPLIGKQEMDWQTETVPDGRYLARVEVSDRPSNPEGRELGHELVSTDTFLVDNTKPEVVGLEVRYPFVAGRARDKFSVITELVYSVDGGEWLPVFPTDGIFDAPVESFGFRIAKILEPGEHTVAVRARDEAGNYGVAQVSFRVAK